jgi:ferredoxin
MEKKKKTPNHGLARSRSLKGFPIDVNVCRNPACGNFGVSIYKVAGTALGYDYKTSKGVFYLYCRRCTSSAKLYSNRSVLEAFHACLSTSIPYASCPNMDCKNHKFNIYEHSPPLQSKNKSHRKKTASRYSINAKVIVKQKYRCRYQARCGTCKQTFTLSEPLRLATNKGEDTSWLNDMELFLRCAVNGVGVSSMMNINQFNPDNYYSKLKAAAASFGTYNKFQLSNLMKNDYKYKEMNIYTDSLVASIKVHREDKRSHKLKIIVSVAEVGNRSLVLAYHPHFHSNVRRQNLLAKELLDLRETLVHQVV